MMKNNKPIHPGHDFQIIRQPNMKDMTVYYVVCYGEVKGIIKKPKNNKKCKVWHPWAVYTKGNPNPIAQFYNDADTVNIPNFDYQNKKTGGKTAAFVYARRLFNHA